jgi:hypothetical protein
MDTLSTNVDIEGEWVYEAEAIENDTNFSGDGCHKRSGEVSISYGGNNELKLTGLRKHRDGCVDNKKLPTGVTWVSDAASLLSTSKQMFVWFSTTDKIPMHGRILVAIKSQDKNKRPNKMTGDMFYLSEENKSWFKAIIKFYRNDSDEARSIEASWAEKR